MAFIDELTISVTAGKGGDGKVAWLHEKGREFGGPAGGNGGNGGDVYAVAVRNVHLLARYRNKKEFRADDGVPGGSKTAHGANAEDLEIPLPIGSVISSTKTDWKVSLTEEGQRVLLLRGGKGGRGNDAFKSSTNQNPMEFERGKPGRHAEFFIEVELVADIGLIGFPNAGKTSLLNMLTAAKGKIGDYPFTTLEPNLGEFNGYIISDIPGLIEGAADGKGLGHKFLRHVKRTKILVHLVSLENDDPLATYKAIRKELKDYGRELSDKREIVLLTKTDIVTTEADIKKVVAKMKKSTKAEDVLAISLYDNDDIKAVSELFMEKLT